MKCIGLGWSGQQFEMLWLDERGNINSMQFQGIVSFKHALNYVQQFARCYELPFCPMLSVGHGYHLFAA